MQRSGEGDWSEIGGGAKSHRLQFLAIRAIEYDDDWVAGTGKHRYYSDVDVFSNRPAVDAYDLVALLNANLERRRVRIDGVHSDGTI